MEAFKSHLAPISRTAHQVPLSDYYVDEGFIVINGLYMHITEKPGSNTIEGKNCFATLVKHAKYAGILKQF